jgi:hypothetical protein
VKNRMWSRRQISADKWSDWCPGKSEILEAHYIERTCDSVSCRVNDVEKEINLGWEGGSWLRHFSQS